MSVRLTKVADVSLTCQSGRWPEMATFPAHHATGFKRCETAIAG